MILIALGANRAGPWGSPQQTVERALRALDQFPLRLVASSRLMLTEPYGVKNQPVFVNAVAQVATHLSPQALLVRLQAIERAAGRQRRTRWGPRTLDLDIIVYHGVTLHQGNGDRTRLTLPHPGIGDRLFVLQPIAEIAPHWRHPVSRHSAAHMIRKLTGTGHGAEV